MQEIIRAIEEASIEIKELIEILIDKISFNRK